MLAKKSTANQQHVIIYQRKVHLVDYNCVADNIGLSSFTKLLLPPESAKFKKIQT